MKPTSGKWMSDSESPVNDTGNGGTQGGRILACGVPVGPQKRGSSSGADRQPAGAVSCRTGRCRASAAGTAAGWTADAASTWRRWWRPGRSVGPPRCEPGRVTRPARPCGAVRRCRLPEVRNNPFSPPSFAIRAWHSTRALLNGCPCGCRLPLPAAHRLAVIVFHGRGGIGGGSPGSAPLGRVGRRSGGRGVPRGGSLRSGEFALG